MSTMVNVTSLRSVRSKAPRWVPAALSVAVALFLTGVGVWFLAGGGVWWLLGVGPFAAVPGAMDAVRRPPNPHAYKTAFWVGVALCVLCVASLLIFVVFLLYLVPATAAMRLAWWLSASQDVDGSRPPKEHS